MLAGCITSLRASLAPGDELVVVDSASDPPLAAPDGARLVRCEEPGASRARNTGWRSARHGLVAFVDDDVRVAPDWADAVRRAFDDPGVAFLTGRLAVPGQAPVERPVSVKDDPVPAPIEPDTEGTLGHSANMAARRTVLAAVGGFDEALGAGGRFRAAEDNDLFDRLLAAGYRGRYEPAARAVHEQWRSRRQLLRLDWAYGIGTGARLRKLWVSDRARAATVARAWLWDYGLRRVPHALRHAYEFELAVVAARSLGTVAGIAWSCLWRVEAGRLSAPRWQRRTVPPKPR